MLERGTHLQSFDPALIEFAPVEISDQEMQMAASLTMTGLQRFSQQVLLRPKHKIGAVSDIDLTIVNGLLPDSLQQATLEAFWGTDSVLKTLATGRTEDYALPMARALRIHVPIIVSGGALGLQLDKDDVEGKEPTTLWEEFIEADHLGLILDAARRLGYGDQRIILGEESAAPITVNELGPIPRDIKIPSVQFPDMEKVESIEFANELTAIDGLFACSTNSRGADHGPDGFEPSNEEDRRFGDVHVNTEQGTKEMGVARFGDFMGLQKENTAYFGDGVNDKEGAKSTGTAVAVANAVPAFRAIADFEVPSVEEQGVAQALVDLDQFHYTRVEQLAEQITRDLARLATVNA